MKLASNPHLIHNLLRDGIDLIDLSQLILLFVDEGQTCNSKEGMEDVDLVAGTISDSTFIVLAVEYKILQLPQIDPVSSVDHNKRTENPPWVADVGKFLGSAIEPSDFRLTLS